MWDQIPNFYALVFDASLHSIGLVVRIATSLDLIKIW